MSKITVEKAKEQNLEIVETQIYKNGAINPNALVNVWATVTNTFLIKDKKYECHPKLADALVKKGIVTLTEPKKK